MPCERAGVHVAVPTHSGSNSFSLFLMDEMQELAIQATNQKGTYLYAEIWIIIDDIELMAWICLHTRAELDKDSLR